MKKLSCTEIEEQTRTYWKRTENNYERYCWYIENLLGEELIYAAQNPAGGDIPRLQKPGKPVQTLALTVGDSFEPLMQVICVLNPRQVALILNQRYPGGKSGNSHGKTLQRLIVQLADSSALPADFHPNLSKENIICRVIPSDTPTGVFRTLRDVFRSSVAEGEGDYPEENSHRGDYTDVVDITGAKKSMVAGAFLYAAHSGLPITYVDFDADAYQPDAHRPYGFACRIGEITNPYEAFRLRDWERVRQLYERYDFRGALELLGTPPGSDNLGSGILASMARGFQEKTIAHSLYGTQDIENVEELVRILEMYEAWDSGDFGGAHHTKTVLPAERSPSAVTQLGDQWSVVTSAMPLSIPSDFYVDKDTLQVYAVDELKHIHRLIKYNQDYRSAFLRAAGLTEVIMTARLVTQIEKNGLRKKLLAAVKQKSPNGRNLFLQLVKKHGETLRLDKLGLPGKWPEQPPVVNEMVVWWRNTIHFNRTDGWDSFLGLRNGLAHRYVSVSHDLAEDALRFVQANLEDFFGQPVTAMQVRTDALLWVELCMLCQLDFLPPRLRT